MAQEAIIVVKNDRKIIFATESLVCILFSGRDVDYAILKVNRVIEKDAKNAKTANINSVT